MEHKEAYELLEAYAFGTVEQEERAGVERHLDSECETCLERLREVAELSVRLAGAVPQRDPSPQVKERLFDQIHPGRRRRSQKRRRQALGWFSGLAYMAAVVALVVWALGLRDDMNQLRTELIVSQNKISRMEQMFSTYSDAALLLGRPRTKLVDLDGVDPNPQAFGKVLIHPEETFGVIYVYRMPQAPEGMEYQLWMMRDGKPASVGVFAVLEDGSAVLRMDELPDPSSIAQFSVTIEPRGGRLEPTGMLYLTGANPLGSSP
jgi:anti-sigma-K factor RskA